MKRKNISVIVGIPTVHGGVHLQHMLTSLSLQTFTAFHVHLIIDGGKMIVPLRDVLSKLHLTVHNMRRRKGQSARINDILKLGKHSDVTILSNDDVKLSPDAVKKIIQHYTATKADLICVHVASLPPRGLFERVVSVGSIIRNKIIRLVSYDTYLICNGRLLCLSQKFVKKLQIPEEIWNNDAYIYHYAKTHGFAITYIDEPLCWYREPQTMKDYLHQTTKFQFSEQENNRYFSLPRDWYSIPFFKSVRAVFDVWVRMPASLIAYVLLYISVRAYKQAKPVNKNMTYWETDSSTKILD